MILKIHIIGTVAGNKKLVIHQSRYGGQKKTFSSIKMVLLVTYAAVVFVSLAIVYSWCTYSKRSHTESVGPYGTRLPPVDSLPTGSLLTIDSKLYAYWTWEDIALHKIHSFHRTLNSQIEWYSPGIYVVE